MTRQRWRRWGRSAPRHCHWWRYDPVYAALLACAVAGLLALVAVAIWRLT